MTTPQNPSYGGIMFPLEMFRPSAMAQLIGQFFVAKARNVLDAKLRLTRHPTAQLVLVGITGSVVGEDEGAFWKDNSDLVMLLSQALPLQTFLFYGLNQPERTEGLIVAQGGRAMMADEVTQSTLGPAAGPDAWPLGRLCEQIGIDLQELAGGLVGCPSIEVPLIEPSMAEDEALLRELIAPGADEPGVDSSFDSPQGPGAAASAGPGAGPHADAPPASRPASAAAGSPKMALAQDEKRRAQERFAEAQQREEYAKAAQSGLRYVEDEAGIIVAPTVSLEDVDILSPYVCRKVAGDLPEGIPRDLTGQLQGKSIDILVKVDFLSEVFISGAPLSKPHFEAHAQSADLAGQSVRYLAVQAPRLGPGTLVVRGKTRVFASRSWNKVPSQFLSAVLDAVG